MREPNSAVDKKEETLTVHVLLRYSAKTGKIDTTMTGLGNALMRLWALQNTPKTKRTIIINRETGRVAYEFDGKEQHFVEGNLGTCGDYGISPEALQEIKDERFDKEEG